MNITATPLRLFACTFLACILGTLTAAAQIGAHRDDLAVGVNGGMTLNKVGFMPDVPQKQFKGFSAGLSLRYTCEKYFNSICALQAEVNYTRVGWAENILDLEDRPVVNKATGQAMDYSRTLDYIQVPIFARMGWGRERRGLQFFIMAGPQLGYFMRESTRSNFTTENRNQFNTGNEPSNGTIAQETMPVENKFDYGIAAGAGIELSLPAVGHIMLDGRYYYGLGDIYGNSKRDYFGRSNFGTISVKLTWLMDILKTDNPQIK